MSASASSSAIPPPAPPPYSSSPAKYSALAAYEVKGELKKFEYIPLPLGASDIEVEVHCCGISHSDVHIIDNEWGYTQFILPVVPGREIVGRVIAVGNAVPHIRVGQRVGVGAQVGSCGNCRECRRDEPQLCPSKVWSYGSVTGDSNTPHTYGGWASHIRVNSQWAFPIPDALPSIGAAPLFEAGLTVWAPLVQNKVKPGDRVGIVGIGGLGHLAIQFAVKLGCHVIGISTSSDKKAEVLALGAHGFINSHETKEMSAAVSSLDYILSTAAAPGIKWDRYLDLLRPDGTLIFVGAPSEFAISPSKLILNRLSVRGSLLGHPRDTTSMLEFCARHGINAMTQTMDMTPEGANAALAKVRNNTARYRMVLVNRDKIPTVDSSNT